MLWIFSTLRALHGFVQRCTVRAFLPLLLVLLLRCSREGTRLCSPKGTHLGAQIA